MANLRDSRIKADRQTIVKSLTGDFRAEHLFTLKQSVQSYRNSRQMVHDCDMEIEKQLKEFESRNDSDQSLTPPPKRSRKKIYVPE